MKRWRAALVLPALLGSLVLVFTGDVRAEPAAQDAEAHVVSRYVEMKDGVRIAIDLWRPMGAAEPAPTILQLTRYWRAYRARDGEEQAASPETQFFLDNGYAVVIADARGTGASFGARSTEFSKEEIADAGELIDWIVRQNWSNGKVATIGASYLGNMAELAVLAERDALVAVVPRFTDFSEFRHSVRPGGVLNAVIAEAWSAFTAALDANDPCGAFAGTSCPEDAPWRGGVKPVDEDANGALLRDALKRHERNTSVSRLLRDLRFADDPFGASMGASVTLDDVSPAGNWRRIDASRTPSYHWASWFDGGTADGVLTRFMTYVSPMRAAIGPWSHGGGPMADAPLGLDPRSRGLSLSDQYLEVLGFLDPLMKGSNEPLQRRLDYFVLGANEWRSTDKWPPTGVEPSIFYFGESGALTREAPDEAATSDLLEVEFGATSGPANRWSTQLGVPVDYPEDVALDAGLVYATPPLDNPIEIVGHPQLTVRFKSTAAEGAIFAYLEAVSPEGESIHLSDGRLRLVDRRAAEPPSFANFGPYHDFRRASAASLRADTVETAAFSLSPIAVRVPASHRLRLRLVGADAHTAERIPAEGPAAFEIVRSADQPSLIALPIMKPGGSFQNERE
ncbi:MAG: CocE/NonD family hydrolase [Pseudomonadota bacterium]